jgi:hypothetical protein
LADFNFSLKYRKGSSQVVADALSRRDEYHLTEEDRQQNVQVLLPQNLFIKDDECQSECLGDSVAGDLLLKGRSSNFPVHTLTNRNIKPLEENSSIMFLDSQPLGVVNNALSLKAQSSIERKKDIKKSVRFTIPLEQSLQRKDFNLLKMPLQMNTKDKFQVKGRGSDRLIRKLTNRPLILNALDDSDTNSDTATNSNYDVANYHSEINEDTDFDEDDVSAVGDVSQFMEFDGQTESRDPIWFQYLLQYLWNTIFH